MQKICTNGSNQRTSGRVGNIRSLPRGDCCHIDNKILKKSTCPLGLGCFFCVSSIGRFHYAPIIYEREFAIQDTILLFMKQAPFCGNIFLAPLLYAFNCKKFRSQKNPTSRSQWENVFIRPVLSRMHRATHSLTNEYNRPVRLLQPLSSPRTKVSSMY